MGTPKDDGRFELQLGALCSKLSSQLRKQGIRFDPATLKKFERHLERIIALSMQGLLNEKERNNAQKRLVRLIEKHVQQFN